MVVPPYAATGRKVAAWKELKDDICSQTLFINSGFSPGVHNIEKTMTSIYKEKVKGDSEDDEERLFTSL